MSSPVMLDSLAGPTGLFWDYDSIPSLEEQNLVHFIHKLKELGDKISGGKGFDTQVLCHHSPKNTEYFRKFGFEVFDQDGDSWPSLDSGVLSVTAKILLWLWDLEKRASSQTEIDSATASLPRTCDEKPPVVVLVTANNFFSSLLTSLKQRGVDVVCLSTFSSSTSSGGNSSSSLRHACTSAVDFHQFLHHSSCVHRHMANTKTIADNEQDQGETQSSESGVQALSSSSSRDKSPPIPPATSSGASSGRNNRGGDETSSQISPTTTMWSPTPREKKDSSSPASRQAVPALTFGMPGKPAQHGSGSGSGHSEDSAVPQQKHTLRRSQSSNPVSRLLAEEDGVSEAPHSEDGWSNTDSPRSVDGESSSDCALAAEQRSLHDELMSAIYMNNVKSAVAALRKMYTRQSRSYRIPAQLALIMPNTSAMLEDNQVDLFHVSVKFSLDCIQWCFGIQRGENVESFKYKMNKNIARWILKETQRKGLPCPATQYTVNIAVALINSILVDAAELEFCFEVLTCLNVPRPVQYFVPIVTSWMNTPPAARVHLDMKVLQKFMYDHPDLYAAVPSASPAPLPKDREAVAFSRGGSVTPAASISGSSSGGSFMSSRGSWEEAQGGAQRLQHMHGGNMSPPDEWIRDSSSSSQQEAREHILHHLNDFGDNSGKLGGGAGGSGKLSRDIRHGASGLNPSTQPLEAKLLKLLMRSAKGELGARVPALYRDEYGEPLRLKGRKLKDILLETGLVEMVGPDGPGDKLFRIIGNATDSDSSHSYNEIKSIETIGGGGAAKQLPHARTNDGMVVGNHRADFRSHENSSLAVHHGGDSYGSSVMQHVRDYSEAGDRGGGEFLGGVGSGSDCSRRQDDVYSPRLMHQHQQHQHQHPHQHPHQQHQHHQHQHYQHQQRSGMSGSLMFDSYGGKSASALREGFQGDLPRRDDAAGYISRLYEERGQPQSQTSPPNMMEAGESFESFESSSGGALSELNLDSYVLTRRQLQAQSQPEQRKDDV